MVIRNVQIEIILQKFKVLHKVLSRLWINDLLDLIIFLDWSFLWFCCYLKEMSTRMILLQLYLQVNNKVMVIWLILFYGFGHLTWNQWIVHAKDVPFFFRGQLTFFSKVETLYQQSFIFVFLPYKYKNGYGINLIFKIKQQSYSWSQRYLLCILLYRTKL